MWRRSMRALSVFRVAVMWALEQGIIGLCERRSLMAHPSTSQLVPMASCTPMRWERWCVWVQAHDGRALVEGLPLSVDDPKPYDSVTLDTPCVSEPCLALSRSAFEELDNLDEAFSLYGDKMGLPQRARASAFT